MHNPRQFSEPGKLHWDACWPSDQMQLRDADGNGFSVAFIPGRLTDHDLLDPQYVYRLRQMSGSLSSAMEKGCWCALQGAYFANWNPTTMVIPYAMVNAHWWDSYFISIDYGFGNSSAAAHLHVRTQDGRIKTIEEIVVAHMLACDFAKEVVQRFVNPTIEGQRRNIVAVYLDPSNFKYIGDGSSIANQINEVLEDYGLGVLEASNDRVGGWQLMYRRLQRGEWQIADTCPKLIQALPSRMHDEKKSGDLIKVPGDPLDDVADCARYGIYTFITKSEKPWELELREELAPMAAQGDLTSCLIRWQQRKAEEEFRYQPARRAGYGPWGY